jgi:hypothetical protein
VSERRRDATATLRHLGLDPEALLAGRAPQAQLTELIAGPEGTALAAALGELPSPAVAAALAALEGHARERRTRKEIRRALYRLRQRGIVAPAPVAPPAPPRALEPVAEGLVSHFDGRGDRILWIVRPRPTGGVLLVAAEANEPAGLGDVQAVELPRKQLRRVRQRVESASELRLVPADWRVVDALLVEAHERAGAPDRQRDYLRVRPRLTADPPAPPVEPVSTRAPRPSAEEAPALAAGAAALLDEPELRGWLPAAEAAAPFIDEIAAVRASPLVLSPLQQQDRLRAVLRQAAAALYPPAVLARRLEGSAYVLAETGRVPAARQALAVALLLRELPREADSPFVAALVERGFRALLAAEAARSEDARRGSLVVTPAEFLRARSSARPGRTRG